MKDPDGREMANPGPLRPDLGITGDNGVSLLGADRGLHLAAESESHPVDLIKGVGKVRQVEPVLPIPGARRGPRGKTAQDFRSQAPVLGEGREGRQVRSQPQINYPGRGKGINQIKEIGSRYRLAEMFVKLLQDGGGDVIEYLEPLLPGPVWRFLRSLDGFIDD